MGDESSRTSAAYFIHLPYVDPTRETGYDELATAVATLVARIVSLEGKST